MYSFSKYKDQYKSNLRLALPVVLTQLGQILTQVADNLMVGRYGGDDPVPLAGFPRAPSSLSRRPPYRSAGRCSSSFSSPPSASRWA